MFNLIPNFLGNLSQAATLGELGDEGIDFPDVFVSYRIVYSLATGTAKAREMHLPANLCRVLRFNDCWARMCSRRLRKESFCRGVFERQKGGNQGK